MKRQYFGTDGIRGRVGEGFFTPEFVLRLGWAAGRVLGHGPGSKILIGKDTRISGYMFESALEAGLVAAGVRIRLLGPMPTPAIAYLTRTLRAQAGIVISASHNPYYDNGIKFFSSDGDKLPDAKELEIEKMLGQGISTVPSEQLGKVKRVDDARGRYIEFCKNTFPAGMDLRGFKIVVDCANGATYHIAPYVLEELGAEVVPIAVEPDGININAGCGATHLQGLITKVLEVQADLGIALDGDGDRVLMVDAAGAVVDGDDILYVLARARAAAGELRGPVVGTLMSNLGLEHALAEQGIALERTKVGDRYILERLKTNGGTLGGEPSGHIICRDRTTTGDGIVSALQVLAELRRQQDNLTSLLKGMRRYPQELVNVVTDHAEVLLADHRVQQAIRDAIDQLSGRGRVLLRPSGTEPLLRIMVEGPEKDVVNGVISNLKSRVEERNRQMI